MRRTSEKFKKMRAKQSAKRRELEQKIRDGQMCSGTIGRGKYAEITIPQVFFRDADYFYWGLMDGLFGHLNEFPKDMAARARHIMPPPGKQGWQFGLRFDEHPELKAVVLLRPENSRPGLILSPHLDCQIYRGCIPPQERSLAVIMNCIVRLYFGGENPSQSHKRCEQFFTTDRNFDLRCAENHRLSVPGVADRTKLDEKRPAHG